MTDCAGWAGLWVGWLYWSTTSHALYPLLSFLSSNNVFCILSLRFWVSLSPVSSDNCLWNWSLSGSITILLLFPLGTLWRTHLIMSCDRCLICLPPVSVSCLAVASSPPPTSVPFHFERSGILWRNLPESILFNSLLSLPSNSTIPKSHLARPSICWRSINYTYG